MRAYSIESFGSVEGVVLDPAPIRHRGPGKFISRHKRAARLGQRDGNLAEELGVRCFGKRPRVGDPFCGGGSIPFEAARIGCDVYASDLNPIACLLTWGALNIVGGTDEARTEIAETQKAVIRAVDEEITRLGIEHDGDTGDLRLLEDAPSRWPHGYKVDRTGEVI